MRQASLMLGILTLLMIIGAYLAFHNKAEAPILETVNTQEPMLLTLSSPVFEANGLIPSKYTCDGENVSPELHIANIPEGTESLILVMDDPDIPNSVKEARGIEKFDHWAVYNIPKETRVIGEGEVLGTGGQNGRGTFEYTGPCPPDREHRYIFRLYAVTGTLNFIKAPTLDEVEGAARGMMIESATLIGRYNRIENTRI